MDSPPHHILILPLPFQGHVMPLMEMSHHLLNAGFTVTFVNTEFNHQRLLHAAAGNINGDGDREGDGRSAFFSISSQLRLLGIPDGLDSDEERKDLVRICQVIPSAMEASLRKVISTAIDEGRPIKWMLADQNMAWAFPLAKEMGLRTAVFWPASAAMLTIMLNIPEMIKTGVIGEDGFPKKHEMFQLAPGMPALHLSHLGWNAGISSTQPIVFSFVLTNNNATNAHAEFVVCNTFKDLEPQALSLVPSIVPVGPLPSSKYDPAGHLWQPESSSNILKWLDSHSEGTVLYIAFGSHTIFDEAQLQELAHGLEVTGRPFLWAVRPDISSVHRSEIFSPEFLKHVEGQGLLVSWAPQKHVLAHPSIGCFISHCGWNSTMEGVRNGLRFLCWPYFTDQFLNQNYICDTWRIGLRVGDDKNGEGGGGDKMIIVTREQIRKRVEELMGDEEMRKRALLWKEKAALNMNPGGNSCENFKKVLELLSIS